MGGTISETSTVGDGSPAIDVAPGGSGGTAIGGSTTSGGDLPPCNHDI